METNNDATFPVVSWNTGIVKAYGAIIFQPNFLTHAMQPDSTPNLGRRYILSIAQAQALIQDIQSALHALQSAEMTPPPDQPH